MLNFNPSSLTFLPKPKKMKTYCYITMATSLADHWNTYAIMRRTGWANFIALNISKNNERCYITIATSMVFKITTSSDIVRHSIVRTGWQIAYVKTKLFFKRIGKTFIILCASFVGPKGNFTGVLMCVYIYIICMFFLGEISRVCDVKCFEGFFLKVVW